MKLLKMNILFETKNRSSCKLSKYLYFKSPWEYDTILKLNLNTH